MNEQLISELPVLANQQGKNECLIFLSSLINIPETIEYTNIVTIKEEIDLSKIPNQTKENLL